ncbi:hypothetical protein G5727_002793 [Listeria monocytogenes]|nr:hypothetical protein [Listeria monocytogenes]
MVRITENKTNLIDRERETGHEKKRKKRIEKERRIREKIKRKDQKKRATTTIPPTPFLHQNLKEGGDGSNLFGQVAPLNKHRSTTRI